MEFMVLAEDSKGKRSAALITAESMHSALLTLAADVAKTQEDFFSNECTIIPLSDQNPDAEHLCINDEYTVRAYLSGNLQRVNICDICICENCNPGLCHSDGYSGKPMERCQKKPDTVVVDGKQISFAMGTVEHIGEDF